MTWCCSSLLGSASLCLGGSLGCRFVACSARLCPYPWALRARPCLPHLLPRLGMLTAWQRSRCSARRMQHALVQKQQDSLCAMLPLSAPFNRKSTERRSGGTCIRGIVQTCSAQVSCSALMASTPVCSSPGCTITSVRQDSNAPSRQGCFHLQHNSGLVHTGGCSSRKAMGQAAVDLQTCTGLSGSKSLSL